MTDRHWQHFPDDADADADADVGGAGPTREAPFEDAARALTDAP